MASTPRLAIALLLLGALILGLSHAALLPPWEGFDETGHYSYIQQLAETSDWPRQHDMMSKDVDDYLKVAPTTESMHGAWTYHRFFSEGRDIIERARQAIHALPTEPRRWEAGTIENWQSQHPPLYYLAMAP